jgi:hypothetical protein
MTGNIDNNLAFLISSDERGGDKWLLILEKIRVFNILYSATPFWFRVAFSSNADSYWLVI